MNNYTEVRSLNKSHIHASGKKNTTPIFSDELIEQAKKLHLPKSEFFSIKNIGNLQTMYSQGSCTQSRETFGVSLKLAGYKALKPCRVSRIFKSLNSKGLIESSEQRMKKGGDFGTCERKLTELGRCFYYLKVKRITADKLSKTEKYTRQTTKSTHELDLLNHDHIYTYIGEDVCGLNFNEHEQDSLSSYEQYEKLTPRPKRCGAKQERKQTKPKKETKVLDIQKLEADFPERSEEVIRACKVYGVPEEKIEKAIYEFEGNIESIDARGPWLAHMLKSLISGNWSTHKADKAFKEHARTLREEEAAKRRKEERERAISEIPPIDPNSPYAIWLREQEQAKQVTN